MLQKELPTKLLRTALYSITNDTDSPNSVIHLIENTVSG